MGVGPIILLLVVAGAVGAAAQLFPGYPGPRTRFDGVIVGIVALVFAYIVNAIRHLGPQWDGLYVVPAIVGAALWGGVATFALRRLGRKEQAQ